MPISHRSVSSRHPVRVSSYWVGMLSTQLPRLMLLLEMDALVFPTPELDLSGVYLTGPVALAVGRPGGLLLFSWASTRPTRRLRSCLFEVRLESLWCYCGTTGSTLLLQHCWVKPETGDSARNAAPGSGHLSPP